MAANGVNVLAIVVAVAYVLTLVANYTVTAGIGVKFTNEDIADSHPTYLLPIGWAFSIWGLIYLLFGAFAVYQALPSTWNDEQVQSVRLHALSAFFLNVTWLYLFSYEVYWIAFLFIVSYAIALLHGVNTLGVDFASSETSWKTKLLVAAPFSANASWVVVASCLQIGVNSIQEGWVASADFCSALLFIAASLAMGQCFKKADYVYGFVAAWALFGIINNQADSSTFGCASRICNAKCIDEMELCSREGRFGPLCASWTLSGATDDTRVDECVIPKSDKIKTLAWVLIASVVLSVLAGVTRSCTKKSEKNEGHLMVQAGDLPNGKV